MFNLPPFTVFDVETTGLDPAKGDRIIEIAGVRVEGGRVQDENIFVQLVNPERGVPLGARQVNKINEEELKTAPTIDQVLPSFLNFASGSILVAQNAQFDIKFLENEKQCCWGYVDLPECLCTMKLSQAVFPQDFRHNLDIIGARLGLNIPQSRHRALPDVLLTAHALLKMIEIGGITSIEQLRRIASIKQLATA